MKVHRVSPKADVHEEEFPEEMEEIGSEKALERTSEKIVEKNS